jgi:hypothetical protein
MSSCLNSLPPLSTAKDLSEHERVSVRARVGATGRESERERGQENASVSVREKG